MTATLRKQAEDLGIDVDKRWSDETLQEKIDEAKAKLGGARPPEAPEDLNRAKAVGKSNDVPVLLKYDYWDAEGERHPAGKVIDVSVDEAKKLLGEKKAERADPLPGEKR